MIALAFALALTVIDRDKFKLRSGEVIRIENIDAPESGAKAFPCFPRA